MVDSHNSPNPLPPAELVGKRLDENRLFEARFLFQKFSSAIDPPVRRKLVQQLATRISRAEKTFAEGDLLEQTGDFEKAIKIFAKVQAMAIDYPSLAEAQERVEVAIKLGPLHSVGPPEQKEPAPEPAPPVTRTESSDLPVAGLSFFQQQKVALILVSALLTSLGLVAVLIFFRPGTEPVAVRPAIQPVSESKTKEDAPAVSGPEIKIINQQKYGEKGPERKTSPGNNSPVSALSPSEDTVSKLALSATPQEKLSSELAAVPLPISGQLVEPVTVSTKKSKSNMPPVHNSPQKTVVSPQGDKTAVTSKDVQEQKHNSQSLRPAVPKTVNREEASQPADVQAKRQTTQDISKVSEWSGRTVENSGKEISSPVNSTETSKTYTVQEGDTLETIADKMYGNRYKWSYIVSANQKKLGRPPYVLTVGMQLQVPSIELLESKKAVTLNDDGTYTVQSGDSLGSIALKLYGTSKKWNTLYELNRDQLPTPGGLQVGQRLLVNKNIKDIPVGKDNNLPGE